MQPQREHLSSLLFYGIVLLLGYLLFRILRPFLLPLGWAAILAIFVYPWHIRLVERLGNTRAAAVSTTIVTMLVVGPGLLILATFIREATAALGQLDPEVFAGPLSWIQVRWDGIRAQFAGNRLPDLRTLIAQGTEALAAFIATRLGGLVANVAVFLFDVFVTLFALFFLLRDATEIIRRTRRILPFDERRSEHMIRQTQELVYASITSGMMIAVLQGFLGGLLFAILGLGAPVFWGVMMGFFSFLPFFGTWVVWLPTAIWLMLTGQLAKGIMLIALGAALVASVDNIVRPALLTGRTQMNGLLMFVSLLGGLSVFGLIGLVLGPLVLALVASLIDAYTIPYEIIGSAGET